MRGFGRLRDRRGAVELSILVVSENGRQGLWGHRADRKRFTIPPSGRQNFDRWLSEPIEPEPHLQTVLFIKVVLSLMLGRSAEHYLDIQRSAHLQRMRELTDRKRHDGLVGALLADHGLFHLEADLRWIDVTAARLSQLAVELTS